jgi:hypothetical protein
VAGLRPQLIDVVSADADEDEDGYDDEDGARRN